ncbi:MAG: hypothetical protein ACD_75C01532G0004 [uncultured bacterium]|nr:MAG: hypothetical protein ACD_75C01532G0004 [uncultured bacterium]
MPDDCQPQSGAAEGAASRLVAAIKAFEQPRQMFLGYAAPGIPNDDPHPLFRIILANRRLYSYLVALFAVGDRIDKKIDHRLLKQRRIHCNHDIIGTENGHANPGLVGLQLTDLHRRLKYRQEQSFFQNYRSLLRLLFNSGKSKKVIDYRAQPLGMAEDNLQEFDGILPDIDRPVEQSLDVAADRGNRGPQLMGNIGDEISSHVLEPPQFRYIVHHHQHPDIFPGAIAEGNHIGLQESVAALILKDDFIEHRLLAGQSLTDLLLQLDIADDLLNDPALCRLPFHPENFRGSGIDADNPLLGIDGDNRFDHTGENRLQLVALSDYRLNFIIQHLRHAVHRSGKGYHLQGSGFLDDRQHPFTEVPPGKLSGGPGHLFERLADIARNEQGNCSGQHHARHRAKQDAHPDMIHRFIHRRHGNRGPEDRIDDRPLRDIGRLCRYVGQRDGDIEQVFLQGMAVAPRFPRGSAKRPGYLLTKSMVVHHFRIFVGIGENLAAGGNYGDPGARTPAGPNTILAQTDDPVVVQILLHLQADEVGSRLQIRFFLLQIEFLQAGGAIPAGGNDDNENNQDVGGKNLPDQFLGCHHRTTPCLRLSIDSGSRCP